MNRADITEQDRTGSTDDAARPVTSMTSAQVNAWIAKAQIPVRELLAMPDVSAAHSQVISRPAPSVAAAPFGGFMLSWPEQEHGIQVLNHLPDGAFFLDLLRRVYAPILNCQPRLAEALCDHSRIEMAITNDVLQVQLNQLVEGYTMIRHHALMLFESMLWLSPVSRGRWAELFDASATLAMAERSVPPSAAELGDIEAAGFEAMVSNAAASADPALAAQLLGSPSVGPVITYQLWASAAIGLLWRDFRSFTQDKHSQWHRRELIAYRDPDYLCDRIATGRKSGLTEGMA
jgi:hypothetical protein